jgi:hypothetical protein
MSNPYRSGMGPTEAACPRCERALPPLDIARCAKGCGTWVTAFAASEAFAAQEIVENRLTRWWKVRAPCPLCSERMTLRGGEPGLFQGCELHGYWVDEDAIAHTGLAQDDIERRLSAKRADPARIEQERQQREELEEQRARERDARQRSELRPDLLPVAPHSDQLLATRDAARAERPVTPQRDPELARVIALVDQAIASGSTRPLASELLRLQREVTALTRRLDMLEARNTPRALGPADPQDV